MGVIQTIADTVSAHQAELRALRRRCDRLERGAKLPANQPAGVRAGAGIGDVQQLMALEDLGLFKLVSRNSAGQWTARRQRFVNSGEAAALQDDAELSALEDVTGAGGFPGALVIARYCGYWLTGGGAARTMWLMVGGDCGGVWIKVSGSATVEDDPSTGQMYESVHVKRYRFATWALAAENYPPWWPQHTQATANCSAVDLASNGFYPVTGAASRVAYATGVPVLARALYGWGGDATQLYMGFVHGAEPQSDEDCDA